MVKGRSYFQAFFTCKESIVSSDHCPAVAGSGLKILLKMGLNGKEMAVLANPQPNMARMLNQGVVTCTKQHHPS